MKRPIVGGFYLHVQTLQTMSQGCCMSNIRVFGLPVHEIYNSPKFTPFCPLLSPNVSAPVRLQA